MFGQLSTLLGSSPEEEQSCSHMYRSEPLAALQKLLLSAAGEAVLVLIQAHPLEGLMLGTPDLAQAEKGNCCSSLRSAGGLSVGFRHGQGESWEPSGVVLCSWASWGC